MRMTSSHLLVSNLTLRCAFTEISEICRQSWISLRCSQWWCQTAELGSACIWQSAWWIARAINLEPNVKKWLIITSLLLSRGAEYGDVCRCLCLSVNIYLDLYVPSSPFLVHVTYGFLSLLAALQCVKIMADLMFAHNGQQKRQDKGIYKKQLSIWYPCQIWLVA